MKIQLFGTTGGIGSAITEMLAGHEINKSIIDTFDWSIFAQGFIGEENPEQTFEANTLLPIIQTELVLPHTKKGFIYISSTSGIRGNAKFPIYSASKAALNSYAETMSRKYPDLQFYVICPGPTDTKMWRNLGLEGKAQSPLEVAKVVKDCMEGKYKSGAIITVRNGVATV